MGNDQVAQLLIFMISKSTQLETDRLILRIPCLEDIPHVFSATRYEGFNDGMQWEPMANEAAHIGPFKRSRKAWESGTAYSFSLQRKEDNAFIGRMSIRQEAGENVWSIGFWTHPKHQGKGYMSEAVSVLLAFGFNTLQAERIEASYAIWNKASERVLQKNGLTFVKYIEQGFMKKGEWVAENLLSINKNQFEVLSK